MQLSDTILYFYSILLSHDSLLRWIQHRDTPKIDSEVGDVIVLSPEILSHTNVCGETVEFSVNNTIHDFRIFIVLYTFFIFIYIRVHISVYT